MPSRLLTSPSYLQNKNEYARSKLLKGLGRLLKEGSRLILAVWQLHLGIVCLREELFYRQ
jgi:hypothetical protein